MPSQKPEVRGLHSMIMQIVVIFQCLGEPASCDVRGANFVSVPCQSRARAIGIRKTTAPTKTYYGYSYQCASSLEASILSCIIDPRSVLCCCYQRSSRHLALRSTNFRDPTMIMGELINAMCLSSPSQSQFLKGMHVTLTSSIVHACINSCGSSVLYLRLLLQVYI
jgi:hypothetical protein